MIIRLVQVNSIAILPRQRPCPDFYKEEIEPEPREYAFEDGWEESTESLLLVFVAFRFRHSVDVEEAGCAYLSLC